MIPPWISTLAFMTWATTKGDVATAHATPAVTRSPKRRLMPRRAVIAGRNPSSSEKTGF
jgi:hypothetical protein